MNLIKTKIRLGIKIIKLGGIGMYTLADNKNSKIKNTLLELPEPSKIKYPSHDDLKTTAFKTIHFNNE